MSEQSLPMTSHRPYLLRALYEWIADNGMTPHLLVDANAPDVRVPVSAVSDGRIVLNIADRAVSALEMSNESIRFSARFGGVSQSISVPVGAVLAIYARETGHGMALPDDVGAGSAADGAGIDSAGTGQSNTDDGVAEPARPSLSAVPKDPDKASSANGDRDDGPDDGPDGPGPRRGGHLRVVK
ncbi:MULTISPECIES: ClpXP protease specificity-enhancing factor [unclassified Lysobacter]